MQGKRAIPSVAVLELARKRLRSLVRFVERTKRNPVYTDFADTLGEAKEVRLPGITPGTNFERFRAKATAYLRQHEDHVALQRLRRNRQLTDADVSALERMLVETGGDEPDLVWARTQTRDGLGVFIRTLVGLDRAAAVEAFGGFLDGTKYNVQQVRFVTLIVDELTRNGVMEPQRLFESPYIDHAPTGPDVVFPEGDDTVIVDTLKAVKARAIPSGAA